MGGILILDRIYIKYLYRVTILEPTTLSWEEYAMIKCGSLLSRDHARHCMPCNVLSKPRAGEPIYCSIYAGGL